YDGLDRKTISTVNFGPFSKTFANSYPDNWTQTFTSPDNLTATFKYDQADRLITASHETAGQVQYSNYLWNLARTKTLPGATINYWYDLNGRLASINALDGLNATLLDRQYSYTPKGDLQSLDTEHGSYTYDHDELSRLTNINAPIGLDSETYTYDGVGNRLTGLETISPWQYNKNNELINQDGTGYTYDATGNIITRTGSQPLTFLYDEASRLTEVQDETSAVLSTYYYDPFGQRLWKDVGETRTYYLYTDQGLIAEYDNTGMEIRSYGYLPGTSDSIAPLYMKTNGSYYWYHNDHLGTPQQLADDTGAIVWEARYTGFGKASIETETIVSNFRLPGQYYDEETGLHYNGNRYYDPDTGRYLRTDPLGLEGGLNLYVYALNNPLMFTDPDGFMARAGLNASTDFYNQHSNTIDSSLQVVGGLAEASVGYTLGVVLSPTVIGGFAGTAIGAHGLDQVWSGVQSLRQGEQVDAHTSQLMQAAGMSRGTANYANNIISVATTAIVGAINVKSMSAPASVSKNTIHRNSLAYEGETHVYRVKSPDGTTYKIGESARGTRVRDGASIRAEQQVRKLNREVGPGHSSEIRKISPNKAAAREYETKLIERYRRIYGQDTLPGNKTNR
ncbi:MAG: RHS domain-containing protein, partial [Deltaproteobacteria bacterium]|nr:RHS domain-containing protein [Deltaproteobacteria bacterium]